MVSFGAGGIVCLYRIIDYLVTMKNVFRQKSFAFAVRIVRLYKFLCEEKKEFVLSKQLLRAGTSIAANHREAEQGESKSDFIHKMAIVQKECNESIYWLELLYAAEYITEIQFNNIIKDAIELMKMSTTILNTSKRNR